MLNQQTELHMSIVCARATPVTFTRTQHVWEQMKQSYISDDIWSQYEVLDVVVRIKTTTGPGVPFEGQIGCSSQLVEHKVSVGFAAGAFLWLNHVHAVGSMGRNISASKLWRSMVPRGVTPARRGPRAARLIGGWALGGWRWSLGEPRAALTAARDPLKHNAWFYFPYPRWVAGGALPGHQQHHPVARARGA